jgi:uncharacterized protein YcbX
MHVSELYIYPVKSLRGISMPRVEIDALGFLGDRRFMVVDLEGHPLTQRACARMARVSTALANHHLELAMDGRGTISVDVTPDSQAPVRTVNVWNSENLQAEDCGNDVSEWLSAALDQPCRMVRIGSRFTRPVLKPGKTQAGDIVHFADAYPFLAISEASLHDLNDRLENTGESAVPMSRFRPNIVIAGCDAFDEDRCTYLQIGSVLMRAAGPCSRCVITTTDQQTGDRGKEPLRMLASYRRRPNSTEVDFGQNLIHETKSGRITVGDPVVFPPK